MRGFVFSLDAFVAFTLALVAVYSLIFFSSVPSSYYYLLTQGHYLARDVLLSTSTTECDIGHYSCGSVSGSILDAMVYSDNRELQKALIKESVGEIVPSQFGYYIQVSSDQGKNWETIYSTENNAEDDHADSVKKLTVSSQIVNFGYTGLYQKAEKSPFKYITCQGDSEDIVITCGDHALLDPDAYGEMVPMPETKLVKLTIFI